MQDLSVKKAKGQWNFIRRDTRVVFANMAVEEVREDVYFVSVGPGAKAVYFVLLFPSHVSVLQDVAPCRCSP